MDAFFVEVEDSSNPGLSQATSENAVLDNHPQGAPTEFDRIRLSLNIFAGSITVIYRFKLKEGKEELTETEREVLRVKRRERRKREKENKKKEKDEKNDKKETREETKRLAAKIRSAGRRNRRKSSKGSRQNGIFYHLKDLCFSPY